MKHLELPSTLRTATIDEIPDTTENREWLQQRQYAKIIEGYTCRTNFEADSSFKFYCEINIDNSKLWELFALLSFTLPDKISAIYSHVDNDPNFSLYLSRQEVIEILNKYRIELSRDGLLEFGVIYQDDEKLIEVFVKKSKFIQYWGNDFVTFENIMKEFGLTEVEGLNFIDEFPLVTIPLRLHNPLAIETEDLLTQLDAELRKGYR